MGPRTPTGSPLPPGSPSAATPSLRRLALLSTVILVTSVGSSLSNSRLLDAGYHDADVLGLLGPLGVAVGGTLLLLLRHTTPTAPLRAHVVCGTLTFLSFWSASQALLLLPYAVFLVAKATRLMPTMLVGAWLLNKRYAKRDWSCAALSVIGLGLVLWHGHGASPPAVGAAAPLPTHSPLPLTASSSLTGGALMLASLLCDAFYSNTQQVLMEQHKSSSAEVSALSFGFAVVLFFVSSALGGTNVAARLVAGAASPSVGKWLITYTLLNTATTLAILESMKEIGAVRTGLLSLVARAASIAVVRATSPGASLLPHQSLGIALVFVGLAGSLALGKRPAEQPPLPPSDLGSLIPASPTQPPTPPPSPTPLLAPPRLSPTGRVTRSTSAGQIAQPDGLRRRARPSRELSVSADRRVKRAPSIGDLLLHGYSTATGWERPVGRARLDSLALDLDEWPEL